MNRMWVIAVVFCTCCVCEGAEWDEVRSAIESRRKLARTISYSAEVVTVASRHLFDDGEGDIATPPNSEPYVYTDQYKMWIDFRAASFRREEELHVMTPRGLELQSKSHTFNGSRGVTANAQSLTKDGKGGPDVVEFDRKWLVEKRQIPIIDPVMLSIGVFHPLQFAETSSAQLGDSDKVVWANRGASLTASLAGEYYSIEYTFDRDYGLSLTRVYKTPNKGLLGSTASTEILIEYVKSESGTWWPSSWTKTLDGATKTGVISLLDLDADVPASGFEFENKAIRPGMILVDHTQNLRKDRRVMIAPNGSRTPWSPNGKPPENDGLSVYWIVVANLVLVGLLVSYWMVVARKKQGEL